MQKNNKIIPCFWFDGNAGEAFELYGQALQRSEVEKMNAFLFKYSIDGCELWGINGGPLYKPNPTISLYTAFDNKEDLDHAFKILKQNAKILMPLNAYEWSDWYVWLEDQYGVSWQLILFENQSFPQKIMPTFMFVDEVYGRAEEAMTFYTSLFPNGESHFLERYADGAQKGKVVHTQFSIDGLRMVAMDSGFQHNFGFTEGVSLVVLCDTQEDIDLYWKAFTKAGEEGRCGWCKDQFGVSWQIIPQILGDLMSNPDTGPQVGACLQGMNKIELEPLLKAAGK